MVENTSVCLAMPAFLFRMRGRWRVAVKRGDKKWTPRAIVIQSGPGSRSETVVSRTRVHRPARRRFWGTVDLGRSDCQRARSLKKAMTHEDSIRWFTDDGAGCPDRLQSGHSGGTGSHHHPSPQGTRLRGSRQHVQSERPRMSTTLPQGRDERSRDRHRAARTSTGTSRSSSPTGPRE